MLKIEDWPSLEKLTALRALEKGARCGVFRSDRKRGDFVDYELERGSDGAMTGYAFPDMLVDLVKLSRAGDRDRAHDLFDAHFRSSATSSSPASASRFANTS